jgi:hypothetical protein
VAVPQRRPPCKRRSEAVSGLLADDLEALLASSGVKADDYQFLERLQGLCSGRWESNPRPKLGKIAVSNFKSNTGAINSERKRPIRWESASYFVWSRL